MLGKSSWATKGYAALLLCPCFSLHSTDQSFVGCKSGQHLKAILYLRRSKKQLCLCTKNVSISIINTRRAESLRRFVKRDEQRLLQKPYNNFAF